MNPSLFLVFIFTALTVFAIYRIVAPFLEDRRDQLRGELLDEELAEIEQLVAKKSSLLQTLRDIESDFETDKISEEDYQQQTKRYERRAVGVMRQLDELRGGIDMDAEIDRELEQLRSERQTEAPASDEAEPTDTIACPECDKQLEAEARFCSRCGTAIEQTGDGESDDERADEETSDDATESRADAQDPSVVELRPKATN